MIDTIYISHGKGDDHLARELARTLWTVNLESLSSSYDESGYILPEQQIRFGINRSDCMIILLTKNGCNSPQLNQEIGLAMGNNHLIVPLAEEGVELPVLIRRFHPIRFSEDNFADALGKLVYSLRQLTRLEWLKISCPHCGEEMTQYITPQDQVDTAIIAGTNLETMCSYCENKLFLDPRTFRPIT
ncbi:toll/interleukin-1 receptor domain-containing protein [Methanolobus sp. ZRKC2]|uniref:toll/interleukin-1 receptor domain-containing protein n=1 Tax=Methanolobus sp. ZRKC2 TaxID=3125783 RepID=UPI00324D2FD7